MLKSEMFDYKTNSNESWDMFLVRKMRERREERDNNKKGKSGKPITLKKSPFMSSIMFGPAFSI